MSAYQRLSFKHRRFVDGVVKTWNPKKAYQKVYPDAAASTVSVNSCKLMQTNEIKEAIEWRLSDLTPEYVLERISVIAGSAKRESDKLKALELLGKYLSLFKNDIEQHHTLEIDLNSLRNRLLQQQKKTIALPENGIQSDTSTKALVVTDDSVSTYVDTPTDNTSVEPINDFPGGGAEAPLGV